MKDSLTLTEIADALDTLADITVSDRIDELAGHNASFWRDAALVLRGFGEDLAEEGEPVEGDRVERKGLSLGKYQTADHGDNSYVAFREAITTRIRAVMSVVGETGRV